MKMDGDTTKISAIFFGNIFYWEGLSLHMQFVGFDKHFYGFFYIQFKDYIETISEFLTHMYPCCFLGFIYKCQSHNEYN